MLKALGKDVAIYGAADFAFRLLGFAVFPIYAHVFSVEEFGIYALVSTTGGIIALFANVGLNNATQRYYWDPQTTPAMQPILVSTGLATLITCSCGLVLLLIVCLQPAKEFIAVNYGIPWTIALIALITIVPEQILQYCLDTLRLHFAPWKFALVSFIKNLLGVMAGLTLIFVFDLKLEGLFLGGLVGAAAGVPVTLFLIRRDITLTYDSDTAKRMITFGYPFIFAGMAYWIFGSVDRWMLVEMSNARQLGLYAIAYKFAGVVLFINTAFGQAWSPFAMKLKRDDEQYRASFARVLSVWLFALTVVGSAVALFGGEVLRLLTPTEYWAASSSLGILVMGIVLSGTMQITAVGISLEGKTRLFAYAAWAAAFANIALNWILIPLWGADGAALATFMSYGLLTSLYLFCSQRLHPIPLEKAKLLYSLTLIVGVTGASVGLAGLYSVYLVVVKLAVLVLMLAGGIALKIVDISFIRKLGGEKAQA